MAVTVSAASQQPIENGAGLWLRLLTMWHAVVGLAGLAGVWAVWQVFPPETPPWQRILLSIILLLTALASAWAIPLIMRRQHRGRMISLVVNYLWFLICFFGALHVLGVFTGLNALANTFGRGIPFLLVGFVGYLVSAFGDRYENKPAQQRLFQRIGQIIMAVAGVIFLFAVDTLSGVLAILSRYNSPLPFALTIGAVLFGVMIWAMWRKTSAEAMGANNAHEETLSGYLFLSPNLLGFLIFFAGPLLFSLYISFTNSDAVRPAEWVGLQNYAKVLNIRVAQLASPDQPFEQVMNVKVYDELGRFGVLGQNIVIGAEDKLFWISLRNTFLFVLLAVPLSVIPALFLANLLNSKLPGMKLYRAIYFIPSIAAVVGIALIWQLLFNATIGYINYGITVVITSINDLLGTAIADPQIRWLSDSKTALLSLVIIVVWQTMGFNTVLFTAGLQNIPKDLYEAAMVDGSGRWTTFWKITLPMLAPTTFFVVTTTTIQAMQVFDHVFILINPPAGPNNSTLTMVLYLYQKGFQRFEQGYAAAIAWVLFIIIFGVTLVQFQRQRASAYDS
ncbi:MAG: sugar ABC transporter permease [Anaerolineae bacterium]